MYDQLMSYELAREHYAGLLQDAMAARRTLRVPGRSRFVRLIRSLMLVLF
jgi:hypothetical protein